jgi:hypothetical protein
LRFFFIAHVRIRCASCKVGCNIIRCQLYGFVEISNCIFIVFFREIGNPSVIMGPEVVVINLYCFAEIIDRLICLMVFQMCYTATEKSDYPLCSL